MKKTILVVFLILFTTPCFSRAKSSVILVSNNDYNNETAYLYTESDQNGDLSRFYKEVYINQRLDRVKEYDLDKFHQGFVLYRKSNRDIITIYSDNFSRHNGGNIKIVYLYNGIIGDHREKYIELVNLNGNWTLVDSNQTPIRTMFIKSKWFMGKVIGVRDLFFNR